jgi:hypothetical protein
MVTKKQFMRELKKRREGILIGGLVGLTAAAYAINQGADLNTIAQAGKGVIDTVLSREAPLQIAKYKVYGMFAFLGMTIGYFADYIIDRKKSKR